ncbi:MAG: MFS transporter [Clostridia bacterium]|nr:MFS transporter [Clostridia bacterium]
MIKNKFKDVKFDYMWVIIGICFLMVAVTLGLCSSGRTLYLTAITDALGLSRGAFSINDSCRFITTTIINIYFGKMVYRFGTKKLICAGFVCLIAFAMINSFATKLITFYIGSVFLGIGLSWTSTTMVSTIINRWCKSNRGTITGAVLAANGIGGAIAVQILSPIIFQEGNPFGYRSSYHLVAIVLFITLILVAILYREQPKGEESNPLIVSKKHKARGTGWVGMDYAVALKKPYFYLVLLCIFFTGLALQGLSGIAVPHMYDVGISIEFVALLTSMSGILLATAKFSIGFLYDRFGMRITMDLCFICALFSVFGLIFVGDSLLGRTIASVRTVISSFALPLETVMLPLYVSDFFGNKDFEKFTGVFVSANYAGYALGSPFGNACYDIFGNYNLAFIVFGIMMIFVTVSMQYVAAAANRDKKTILNEENAQENTAINA